MIDGHDAPELVSSERMRAPVLLLVALTVGCGGDPAASSEGDGDAAADTAVDASSGVDAPELPEGDAAIFPTEDAGEPVLEDAGPPDAPAPKDYPLPLIPTTCTRVARVLTLNPNGWGTLLDALEANVSPCAEYFVHLPAFTGDKTLPRGPLQPAGVRARKGRFFAVADFDWAAWAARTDLSWFDKGVEFRKRMEGAGYNVARGDIWLVRELPAAVRSDAATRTNVRDLLRGLFTGPTGARTVMGAVLAPNMAHETTDFASYEPNLKTWTVETAFWTDVGKYVRFWGQAAYVSSTRVCVGGQTLAARAARVNAFVMHPASLASATGAPLATASARTFFGGKYLPMMTAFWKSTAQYGDNDVSLDLMKRLVNLELYAVRVWQETHTFPGGRLGLAWDEAAGAPAERAELAVRVASAIRDAWAPGATALRACNAAGTGIGCDCTVAGALFNDGWNTFTTW